MSVQAVPLPTKTINQLTTDTDSQPDASEVFQAHCRCSCVRLTIPSKSSSTESSHPSLRVPAVPAASTKNNDTVLKRQNRVNS